MHHRKETVGLYPVWIDSMARSFTFSSRLDSPKSVDLYTVWTAWRDHLRSALADLIAPQEAPNRQCTGLNR